MTGSIKHKKRSFKDLMKFYYIKAIREKGTPQYIAKGWALGVCIGFAIPFGLQLMVSIPLSFLLKCSKLGASIGTLVTNHFTIIVIYPFQTWLGNRVVGGSLTLGEMKYILKEVFEKKDYATLFNLGMEVTISFLLGGLILALVGTPVAYYLVRTLVTRYRQKKHLRRQKKRLKIQKESYGNRTEDHN